MRKQLEEPHKVNFMDTGNIISFLQKFSFVRLIGSGENLLIFLFSFYALQ